MEVERGISVVTYVPAICEWFGTHNIKSKALQLSGRLLCYCPVYNRRLPNSYVLVRTHGISLSKHLRCLAETTPSVLLVPPSVPGLWHIPQQYGKLLTCELHSRLYRYQPASEEKQWWGSWRPQMLNKDDNKTTRVEETQSFCMF